MRNDKVWMIGAGCFLSVLAVLAQLGIVAFILYLLWMVVQWLIKK